MARQEPGSLSVLPYIGSAVANSRHYVPREKAGSVTLFGVATTAGTFEYFLIDEASTEISLGAAAAVAADTLDSAQVNLPVAGVFRLMARFTDTSAGAGTVRFHAGDDANTK